MEWRLKLRGAVSPQDEVSLFRKANELFLLQADVRAGTGQPRKHQGARACDADQSHKHPPV
jgi:hypothetical protein